MPTIGWSNFALKHSKKEMGNSYTTLSNDEVIRLIQERWNNRKPGAGESDCTRKVLVPVPAAGFFCAPVAKLVLGMSVQAEVVQRQEGEEPYVQAFVTPQDAAKCGALVEVPAEFVDIVCYSAEALEENEGERSTDCEWELVTILAMRGYRSEPMMPLAMARNFLEKPGGTKGVYTAQEFAEAIWHWANKGIRVREPNS
jgi:hypothetical protein